MAARALLRKLDGAGLIELPAPVRSANTDFKGRRMSLRRNEKVVGGGTILPLSYLPNRPMVLVRVKSCQRPWKELIVRGLLVP